VVKLWHFSIRWMGEVAKEMMPPRHRMMQTPDLPRAKGVLFVHRKNEQKNFPMHSDNRGRNSREDDTSAAEDLYSAEQRTRERNLRMKSEIVMMMMTRYSKNTGRNSHLLVTRTNFLGGCRSEDSEITMTPVMGKEEEQKKKQDHTPQIGDDEVRRMRERGFKVGMEGEHQPHLSNHSDAVHPEEAVNDDPMEFRGMV
jgi:hypothetical protein